MSDSFLFECPSNKWQLLVFGTSLSDARRYVKNTHPGYHMKFVGKNVEVSRNVCCATTEAQVKLNRERLYKFMEE